MHYRVTKIKEVPKRKFNVPSIKVIEHGGHEAGVSLCPQIET